MHSVFKAHFVDVDTPGHYTSMACSKCHCRCGPFEVLETERMVKLGRKGQLRGDNKKKKARYHEIRGLLSLPKRWASSASRAHGGDAVQQTTAVGAL